MSTLFDVLVGVLAGVVVISSGIGFLVLMMTTALRIERRNEDVLQHEDRFLQRQNRRNRLPNKRT